MRPIHVAELTPVPPRSEESGLRLHVVYTGPKTTRASLKGAGVLARDLGARLELLVGRVVPYPLPLDSPPASSGFSEAALGALASECGGELDVRILLCRDVEETIPASLPAGCIVVIGRRRGWGPGSHRRLIRAARRDGRHVIVVEGGR